MHRFLFPSAALRIFSYCLRGRGTMEAQGSTQRTLRDHQPSLAPLGSAVWVCCVMESLCALTSSGKRLCCKRRLQLPRALGIKVVAILEEDLANRLLCEGPLRHRREAMRARFCDVMIGLGPRLAPSVLPGNHRGSASAFCKKSQTATWTMVLLDPNHPTPSSGHPNHPNHPNPSQPIPTHPHHPNHPNHPTPSQPSQPAQPSQLS